MYLHLGRDVVVPCRDVTAIFDLDNTTGSAITRDFLTCAERAGSVINISDDIPRSFVLCDAGGKQLVYLSQLSPQTLQKRFGSLRFS